jgi:hypothetical protein
MVLSKSYPSLSLPAMAEEFNAMARDARRDFGHLSERQLNWRPDQTRWSVAQCFDHLLNANREMFRAMDRAIDRSSPRTVWQRLPVWPRLFGKLMIGSQAPNARRRFTAPRIAHPAASAIGADIIERFVVYQLEATLRLGSLSDDDVKRIMTSPFASFVTYSVLDGCRLIVAHQRRHFEQAVRVTREPAFSALDSARR